MRISRRALLATLPFVPGLAQTQALALGSNAPAFENLLHQIGGTADISPILLKAAHHEFVLAYGEPARLTLMRELGKGSLADRLDAASPLIKEQVAFLATLLFTGEVTSQGRTKVSYYPWCLAWNTLTFASAPGLCGGPGFGHWTHAPIRGAM